MSYISWSSGDDCSGVRGRLSLGLGGRYF